MYFPFDTTTDGSALKVIDIIEEFTFTGLTIVVDRPIDADASVAALD